MSRQSIRSLVKAYDKAVHALPVEEPTSAESAEALSRMACAALTMLTRAAEAREAEDRLTAALMQAEPGAKATSLLLPEPGDPHMVGAHQHNLAALRRAFRAVFQDSPKGAA